MKKLFHIVCTLSFVMLIASSCKHDNNTNVTPSGTTGTSGTSGTSSTTVPGSDWSLTLFSEKTEDKTSHFSGYKFEFAADGTMSAVRNGQSVSGTWRQYSNNGVTKFAITLTTTDAHLLELNDDWVLVSKTDNLLSLKDDNSDKNEQLQFSK